MTLIAIATAAGFVFRKFSTQANRNREPAAPELMYKPNIFATKQKYQKNDGMINHIEVLPEYEVAEQLVQNNFPIIFVTGGAGTGKSTFVKWMEKRFQGRVLLGAPTAISAININGKTLHSLCQLPPAWILKSDIKKAPRRREIQEAKLLIIDEVSMVNANILDGVSAFFRLNRGVEKPFGGLPVIMVGDMFQLPPVVGHETRGLFEQAYGTPKFYNAKSLGSSTYYAIELKKTFRQSDQAFVDLLTNIREGHNLAKTLEILNNKCLITHLPPKGAVWLSPRNTEVDTINDRELNKLEGKEYIFGGERTGTFKNGRLPAPMRLRLKQGAQIMFTQNDKNKRWINGTIGVIMELSQDDIVVELSATGEMINIEKATWVAYRYEWNFHKKTIDRLVTGSYKQFPVVLAWAMTIHKSQGKTIDKVHLELGAGVFETGQTYVALSRCRSISGLSMSRALSQSDVLVDEESKSFYDSLRAIIEKLPPQRMLEKINQETSRIPGNR
ncbi:MAG: DEAD/DEAH box helicase [Desulfobacterales bacterium]|nr:DEAD/DEAH box helicase [Desulfobacterales bacterium]